MKSKVGIDGIEFEFILHGHDAAKRLPSLPLKNSRGVECGKIEIKEGIAKVSICLPKFVRMDNIEPFSAADMLMLDSVRNDLKSELQSILDDLSDCWLKSVEVNLTKRVIGASTPNQVLHLIHTSYADSTNQIFEGPAKWCKYHKEKETLIIRVKNYYVIKAYNKSLQQQKDGNRDVENGLLRIEIVMQDRIIRRLFGKRCSIFEVLQECNLIKVIEEFHYIFAEDIVEKHIEPCKKEITKLLVESLMEMSVPRKTIYKYKEIILDVELLRNALKKWYDLWNIPDNSRQDLYRLKEYDLPRDVIKTIQSFLDSCK